jgi:hypothetical protein
MFIEYENKRATALRILPKTAEIRACAGISPLRSRIALQKSQIEN